METALEDPVGVLVAPERHGGTGVLTVAGSSGRVDAHRARLLAAHGALAMSMQWFGGPGQHPGPWEIPLETFSAALDRLAPACDRLVLVGTSFGAEAVLQVACTDPRVDVVVGFAPSAHTWAGVTEEGRQTSHWTRAGRPLPFVPLLEDWESDAVPPSYRDLYDASLRARPDRAAEAAIPVEQIAGEVLLVAGGDDRVWAAESFADALAVRRRAAGRDTTVVSHPGAGHRTVLPGERPVAAGRTMARGGTPEADARLGRLAWPHLVRLLRLDP